MEYFLIFIAIFYFLCISALWVALGYAFYYIVWRPSKAERAAKRERLRRYYDRRG